MTWSFLILAVMTVLGAIAVMALRNLVHCALCLVLTLSGLAGLFLQLSAEFAGLVQVLVYVGAVAILIVFAILLTRHGCAALPGPIATGRGWGLGIAVVAFLAVGAAIRQSPGSWRLPPPLPETGVRAIGEQLMRDYVLPLEVMGLLLTAALIGGVILAMQEPRPPGTITAAPSASASGPGPAPEPGPGSAAASSP